MQRLVSTDRVHVFAEPGTPARSLSERVVLIGHLFPKHAEQLGCLTSSRSDASVFQQLLADFWGDYVVIDATGDASQPLRIRRSTSGGITCAPATGTVLRNNRN